ncbi:hypothetical protein BCR33DRAFT_740653 [Rhizoclosmatium globosum]|uniref:Transcriptional coactivator p15 (PC4) C-terminal domain-containing protein n=1 Tax=Rhizoclosmatium globosum TaxID=329046 RepID=A0A1Y2C117_9FUNG|nr:hypothetical protein BCR33DRAFT_740653 [Rhizoclosmatium globosum]|eukprot:ORY39995.1 hypothetical protein BCR33DRAFT_740653 [Rhizoclosmatium globosum]
MGKRKEEDDFIDDSEEPETTSKAANKKQKPSKDSSTSATKEADEKKVYNLSQRKRAQTNEYKGHKYADIREYYEEKGSGEWKPGKKGITLNKAELVEFQKVIQNLIDEL